MATFKWDCPHPACRAQQAAFQTLFSRFNPVDEETYVVGRCPVCGKLTTFQFSSRPIGLDVSNIVGPGYDGDPFAAPLWLVEQKTRATAIIVRQTFPPPPSNTAPAHVPESVSKPFLEGVTARDANLISSAVYNMRKALERTVHQQDAEGTGTLKTRIKRLAEQQKIPPTLVDLAHTVRAEGNVEVHEDEDWTAEQVQELIDFTSLLLTYVYTLPVKIGLIAEHRGKAAEKR